MDLTAFTRITNESSTLFLYLLPLLLLIVLKQIKSSKAQNLPPGPRPWPIIGNILHMGTKPHISLTNFSRVHGPLMSLRLGSQLLIVGSTPAAAIEILKTHDRLLSGRYLSKTVVPSLQPYSLIFSGECSDHWKSLRTLGRSELFSVKAIESQSSLRETKVKEMVEFLSSMEGKQLKIGEVVFATIFNTLGNLFFSQDFLDLKEDPEVASGLHGTIRKMLETATTPNIADFFPIFGDLDLQGLRKRASELLNEIFSVWEVIIKERRANQGVDASKKQDFCDIMLSRGFSDIQIGTHGLDLFVAGTDTSTSTIEWAMTELLRNKDAMYKVGEELKREISGDSIKESQISNLPYLQACVKETLRLHPAAPFLLPHRALDTCEVMNYTIPKNSQVLVNVWAIGRDPTIWEDPLSFKPERFLDSTLDFKGQDYEFLPFGAGRRMCPGLPLGTKQTQLILAALIHSFEWSLAENEDPLKLDMNEKLGITLQKEQPLKIILKKK